MITLRRVPFSKIFKHDGNFGRHMAMDGSLYLENAWYMKVTRTPSMMQKISWRCDDYHANTIILNQTMGYVLSEKIECVATLVTGYCTTATNQLGYGANRLM